MTFKQFEAFLKAVNLAVTPAGTFLHGGRKKLSAHFGNAFPQTHLMPLVKQEVGDNITFTCTLVFFEQDTFDSSLDQQRDIIDTAEGRLHAFFTYIENNNLTYSIGEKTIGERETLYTETLQAIATGISVRFTLKMKASC